MRRCKNCLMPLTKPGLVLDEEGICQACNYSKIKKSINYEKRLEELKTFCEKYKRNDGYYDCIVTVSGGKDSHYQVYVLKKICGMNPLLISVEDYYSKTKAGIHNLKNIQETFNCDLISLKINPSLGRKMSRIAFENFGSPNWLIDRAIYSFPIKMAINMKIPLIIYGENISAEYGGFQSEETYSAKEQINNNVVKKVDWNLWHEKGITNKELNMFKYPSQQEIEKASLEPIYLSYFVPWSGFRNYQIAQKYGFHNINNEWKREGYVDCYDQVDSVGYLLHGWMKYPKFGFARVTDTVGWWIRDGKITKEQAIKLIKENDSLLDQKILDDFLNFTGYTIEEFWEIVEKFWNREIFEKIGGSWRLKPEHELS